MKVNPLTTSSSELSLGRSPIVTPGGVPVDGEQLKSIGETPPVVLSLEQIGRLATLFKEGGKLDRIRKRLNHLKKKKNRLLAADGTIACADDDDNVYVGVKWLEEFEDDDEVLAGVLAHEWGHTCALKPTQEEVQKLNWNQIFDLRKAHETLADEISGRMLFRLGLTTKGLIDRFLLKLKEVESLKYHSPEIRAKVINFGFEDEKRNAKLVKELFPNSGLNAEYNKTLLDIV